MLIPRTIQTDIEKNLENEKVLILKGARQTGKTTLLKQLEEKLKQDNHTTVFLYGDDLSRQDLFQSPQTLIDYLNIKYNFPQHKIFLFIDEFQYIENAGLFLKNLYDQHKNKLKIIVSGSSSLEITHNSEFLTGRHIPFQINRISFAEYFAYKEQIETPLFEIQNQSDIEKFYSALSSELKQHFQNYLRFGGYPAVLTHDNLQDKKQELELLIKTYLEKDIINFLKIENIQVFRNLIKLFCSQAGSLINVRELSASLQSSQDTIKKYLNVLEGTYLIHRLPPYFTNIRKSLSKMHKAFVLDTGIINLLNQDLDNFEQIVDLGHLVENFVFLELFQRQPDLLYFYRTISGSEIDFVLDYKEQILLEVKYRNKIPQRFLAFENFQKTNSNKTVQKQIIITKHTLSFQSEIVYIPACLLAFIKL